MRKLNNFELYKKLRESGEGVRWSPKKKDVEYRGMSRWKALLQIFRYSRIYGAYSLLRGKSVMFRMKVERGGIKLERPSWVVENYIDGTGL